MRIHGLKVLGLALLCALGAMALAAGAQAQTHTELLTAHADHNKSGGTLNPSPLTNGGTVGKFSLNLGEITLSVPITATQIGTGVLLVAGRSIEVRCTGLTLTGAAINNNTDASGAATFTGCKTFDHKALTEIATCLLKELEKITAQALVLPILHGGELFILFEPLNLVGTTFATISYKPGIGCTLPLNNPVTGSVVALVSELEGEVLGIKFSEGIQLLLGDSLAFGGFASYITAEGTVEPTEAEHKKIGVH